MPAGDDPNDHLEILRDVVTALNVGPFVDDDPIEVFLPEMLEKRWRDGNEGRPATKNRCGTDTAREYKTSPASGGFQTRPVVKARFETFRKLTTLPSGSAK
jgi:hypothetical protein